MNFDLIITTYNRPKEVSSLVTQAMGCDPAPETIIVVDSSDEENTELSALNGVRYIRSSHKNQPYQRLLGALTSEADIVVFLDDDLDIIDPEIFKILITSFVDSQTVGATVNINIQSFIGEEFELPLLKRDSKIFKFISWLTSAKLPPRGKSGRLGIVGGRPDQSQNTEFFSGACMTFRREIIPNIIPYSLISLYERKLGKGEDKVISMFANRFGTLKYYHKICLMHPPNDSSYYKNVQDFFKRVMYSRLYLSKVYAKVFSHSLVKEILIYYWFGIWRLMIATITYFAKPSKTRKDKVLGILNGLWLSLTLPHKPEKITPGINWDVEIQKDLARASNS